MAPAIIADTNANHANELLVLTTNMAAQKAIAIPAPPVT